MRFFIELEIGLFFPLKSALSKLKIDRNTKTHRRGPSKRQYGLAGAAPRSRRGTRSRRRTARAARSTRVLNDYRDQLISERVRLVNRAVVPTAPRPGGGDLEPEIDANLPRVMSARSVTLHPRRLSSASIGLVGGAPTAERRSA